jgi:MFS superfamily sulfate permease-like transporter
MMLVIYSEALGAAKTFADKHGYRIDSDQELIALGLANLGSGLLGGLAAGGSLSQTAVNDGAGARSEASPIVASALSLITVLVLTPLFRDLPEAVLAALIIHAVSHLMKMGEMREYRRLSRREFSLAALTLVSVVVLDVLPALIIGVVVSLVMLIGRASRPKVSILGRDPRGVPELDHVTRPACIRESVRRRRHGARSGWVAVRRRRDARGRVRAEPSPRRDEVDGCCSARRTR